MSQIYAPSKVSFNFRAISEAAKIKLVSQGKPVPAKRDNFTAELNYLTIEGIMSILADESAAGDKMRDLLLDSVNATIFAQAKEFVDSDEGQLITGTGDMPHDRFTWEAVALMPKESRASTAIPKEMWDAFVMDYVAVMPAAVSVTTEQAKAAAATFKGKFAQVKTNKEALAKLLMRLEQWQSSSANGEEFSAIYEVLKTKGTEFLNFDPASQAEAY